jgi:hypothetical protein
VRDAVDIAAWLRELGLERYADAFEANAIDHEVLSEVTEADLGSSADCACFGALWFSSTSTYLLPVACPISRQVSGLRYGRR